MEMDVDKAVPLWQAFLKDVEAHTKENLQYPPSTVLPNEAAYKKFTTEQVPKRD